MTSDVDEYDGPAIVAHAAACHPVRVSVAGRFEPVDGRYHWGGRIAPEADLARLARAGAAQITLRIAGGPPALARLSEVDPWGGIRIEGTGTPPWPS